MGAQWGYNQIDGLKNGWRGGGVCCGLVIQNEREPLGIESVCVWGVEAAECDPSSSGRYYSPVCGQAGTVCPYLYYF